MTDSENFFGVTKGAPVCAPVDCDSSASLKVAVNDPFVMSPRTWPWKENVTFEGFGTTTDCETVRWVVPNARALGSQAPIEGKRLAGAPGFLHPSARVKPLPTQPPRPAVKSALTRVTIGAPTAAFFVWALGAESDDFEPQPPRPKAALRPITAKVNRRDRRIMSFLPDEKCVSFRMKDASVIP